MQINEIMFMINIALKMIFLLLTYTLGYKNKYMRVAKLY